MQDIRGLTRIVVNRLDRPSTVLAAMIAGTLHPKPSNNGMNDLPCNPIFIMILSMTKAARAKYPVSSKIEIAMYMNNIGGRNVRMNPTPPIKPSDIREATQSIGI